MSFYHSYPPTGSGPDELDLLTQINSVSTGPAPQAQILAIINGLLEIKISQHHEALEQSHSRELNACNEAWERHAEEARNRELVMQTELATLRGQLDQKYVVCVSYWLH